MKTFTPIADTELQLTDEQLSLVVGGCGRRHSERSENFESIRWNRYEESDCDDRGRRRDDDDDCGRGWHRGRREHGCRIL